MQNLENEISQFEKIRNFIRLQIENSYSKIFCKKNGITRGIKYNINEFIAIFTDDIISKFYEKINHNIDEGELIYKKIMDINNILLERFSDKCLYYSLTNDHIKSIFNGDNFRLCFYNKFYLSLKNIKFIDLITNPYGNNNIEIYTIDKKFNNDFIEIDPNMTIREFEMYFYRFYRYRGQVV